MLNRKIQVDWVKDKKSAPAGAEATGPSFEEKTVLVTDSVERVVRKIGFAVGAYIVLDTIRKIAIQATKPE